MSADPSKLPAGIAVYRIVGVSAERLRAAMAQAWNGLSELPPTEMVGDKQVVIVQMTGQAMLCCSDGPQYMYSHGEALFVGSAG